jgi:hypothetical protein
MDCFHLDGTGGALGPRFCKRDEHGKRQVQRRQHYGDAARVSGAVQADHVDETGTP